MPTLDDWATTLPDGLAVVSESGSRTFAELNANATQLARALRKRGLKAGDSVALLCGNRPEFAETLFACQRSGLRLTPINWHLSAEEVGYIVGDCEAKALIAEAAVPSANATRQSATACGVALAVGGEVDGFEDYARAVAQEDATPLADASPGGTMLYTSGTTGRPKGVHRPPVASVLANINFGDYAKAGGDRHLCTGPLYHAAPLNFSLALPLACGATVVLMPKWDAERALQLIDRHRVTHTHLVPTMFHRLLSLSGTVREKYDTSSLRHVLHGAAPCPVPVKRRMIDWLGPIIWEYYAATEGLGSVVDSATWLEHPGTVGRPFVPGLVVIGDEDGNPLPAGEVGSCT